jgi:hypothetical protein
LLLTPALALVDWSFIRHFVFAVLLNVCPATFRSQR